MRQISTRRQYGYKISALMGVDDDQINDLIPALTEETGTGKLQSIFVKELIEHMPVFDELMFERTCPSAIVRYGKQYAVTDVIYPFLRKTGVLWSTSNATPPRNISPATLPGVAF
jgi:MerR family transcriptional regulator, light-induced transcriptional regulator